MPASRWGIITGWFPTCLMVDRHELAIVDVMAQWSPDGRGQARLFSVLNINNLRLR
jgi:hypothetical protein